MPSWNTREGKYSINHEMVNKRILLRILIGSSGISPVHCAADIWGDLVLPLSMTRLDKIQEGVSRVHGLLEISLGGHAGCKENFQSVWRMTSDYRGYRTQFWVLFQGCWWECVFLFLKFSMFQIHFAQWNFLGCSRGWIIKCVEHALVFKGLFPKYQHGVGERVSLKGAAYLPGTPFSLTSGSSSKKWHPSSLQNFHNPCKRRLKLFVTIG